DISSTQEIFAEGTRMLGELLGASRCGFAEVDAVKQSLVVCGDWTDSAARQLTSRLSLSEFGPALVHYRGAAQLIEVDAAVPDISSGHVLSSSSTSQDHAGIAFPLMKNGRCIAA